MSVEDTYQMKTAIEHVLTVPDTYIGSVEPVSEERWMLEEDRIVQKEIAEYIPGLQKLFDEAIVNCRDHIIRCQTKKETDETTRLVTRIEVDVSEDGTISLFNDGDGIDVVEHPEHKLWVPEMIFGHLLTSTNYDRSQKRIVGGKNGYGVKVIFIWSTNATIETVDHRRGLKYTQTFSSNLSVIGPPKVTKATGKPPYTRITFRPDYARFGCLLSDDMRRVMFRRCCDIAAVTDESVKVKLNGKLLPVRKFASYVDLFVGGKATTPRAYEKANDRWEYAVCITPNEEFMHMSFVNGIHTPRGGKHVEYILNQITRKLVEFIEKKKKQRVSFSSIKEQLMLFLRCDIENPDFQGQAKEEMASPLKKFGSSCEVSDAFIEKIASMGVMARACAINAAKEQRASKANDGSKSRTVTDVPKLRDAEYAGTAKSHLTTLLITEGDSACTAATSGLSSEDRKYIGLWAARGKLLNVRDCGIGRITEDSTYIDLKKILGLQAGKKYTTLEEVHKHLRYGKIRLLTDQDLDGSHIKGLFINFFHALWKELLQIEGFFGYMITPIVKVTKGSQVIPFYDQSQYTEWKNSVPNAHTWSSKYYKGLGTSSKAEFMEYFRQQNYREFLYTGEASDQAIDLAFNKKRAEDRKKWIGTPNIRNEFVNPHQLSVTYEEFINRELVHFSIYDNERNIANIVDGLKTSMRKALFAARLRNLKTELKVAQFAAYAAEQTHYNHGETSLSGTIIGLNQTHLGSNNVNLLKPAGQFGTRLKGGKDASAARYIYTSLEEHTTLLFPSNDDPLLQYKLEGNDSIEPVYYVPIVPIVLLNGTNGIGTGYSSNVPSYNKYEILDCLLAKLNNPSASTAEVITSNLVPYFEGFKGTVRNMDGGAHFEVCGVWVREGVDKIRVTELPVGTWTSPYVEMLRKLEHEGKIVKSVTDSSNDIEVNISIQFQSSKLDELLSTTSDTNLEPVDKFLQLTTRISTTNMVLFDADENLKHYQSPHEIIDDFFSVRLNLYIARKQYEIEMQQKCLQHVSNKVNYIEKTLSGDIDLRRKSTEEIYALLHSFQLNLVEDKFDYLTKLPMDAVSASKVEKLKQEAAKVAEQLERTKQLTPIDVWKMELYQLRECFIQRDREREIASTLVTKEEGKKGGGGGVKANPKKRKNVDSSEMK